MRVFRRLDGHGPGSVGAAISYGAVALDCASRPKSAKPRAAGPHTCRKHLLHPEAYHAGHQG